MLIPLENSSTIPRNQTASRPFYCQKSPDPTGHRRVMRMLEGKYNSQPTRQAASWKEEMGESSRGFGMGQ
jgi:hypothetical protein